MTDTNVSYVKSPTLDEKLIELVRINPVLYQKDIRCKPYESMMEKRNAWKSIATSLGVDPNYCMTHWNNLRDRYQREKGLTAKDKADDWPLMKNMRFLDHHRKHQNSYKLPEERQQTELPPPLPMTQEVAGGINLEEPLQEAMDEQPTTSETAKKAANTLMPTFPKSDVVITPIKRIEVYLNSLGAVDRAIAEKRILTYLLKCQLTALEGGSVDNIAI